MKQNIYGELLVDYMRRECNNAYEFSIPYVCCAVEVSFIPLSSQSHQAASSLAKTQLIQSYISFTLEMTKWLSLDFDLGDAIFKFSHTKFKIPYALMLRKEWNWSYLMHENNYTGLWHGPGMSFECSEKYLIFLSIQCISFIEWLDVSVM